MARMKLAPIALVLLVSTAAAAEPADLEERWHEAYVAEVIEGKVAEAARAYLALLEEEGLTPELARECRFRFAVCCALLGRTDEARARLAELAVQDGVPAGFRARVEEYRKALEGVGVGSELEKKLDALVFELGRVGSNETNPAVYRDFQIIGKPAVARLEKLLSHPDEQLRIHAFRILCRMDEEGALRGIPEVAPGNPNAWSDLGSALDRNPQWRESVESYLAERLPESTDDRHVMYLVGSQVWQHDGFSTEFIGELARREGYERVVKSMLARPAWSPDLRELVATLIREGPDDTAGAAAGAWLEHLHFVAPSEMASGLLDPELFPVLVRRILAAGNLWWSQSAEIGLMRFGRGVPPEVLLEVFPDILEHADPRAPNGRRILDSLGGALWPLGERSTLEQLTRFVRLRLDHGVLPSGSEVRQLFLNIPLEEGRALVRRYLAMPWPNRSSYPNALVRFEEPRDVELLLLLDGAEELRALGALAAGVLDSRLASHPSKAFSEAFVRQFPRVFASTSGQTTFQALGTTLLWLTLGLPPEDMRKPLLGAAAKVPELPEALRNPALFGLFRSGHARIGAEYAEKYLREVRVPALAEAARVSGEERMLVDVAAQYLGEDGKPGCVLGPARETALAFLAGHLETVVALGQYHILTSHPAVFPPEEWFPLLPDAPRNLVNRMPREVADRAARWFGEHPESLNRIALKLMENATPENKRTLFDRVLSSGRVEAIETLAPELRRDSQPASVEALETALEKLLAGPDTPPEALAWLGRTLARRRPSERLFPLVRRLLARDDPSAVAAGIALAEQLGSRELVPPIIEKLDSLDESIRTAARKAVDGILEIGRIKEEAKRRLEED